MAKTVKIGDEYYSEGVRVAAPVSTKPKVVKKVVPAKKAGSGLAGRLDTALAAEKKRRGKFSGGLAGMFK